MKARGTRLLLTVTVASAVGAGAGVFVAAVLVLGATGTSLVAAVATALAVASVFVVWAASSMLIRRVARPVERILTAAQAIQPRTPESLPLVGEAGLGLDQAALAFERTAAELAEERARLAVKVEELTRANRALEDARESLVRTEKLATVGRLAAGIAHEVGNPLGAISGYAEIARSRLPPGGDSQLEDSITRIASAAARIDLTVRGLLDFARPVTLELGPVSVPSALEAALQLARVQPRFRDVEVDVRIPGDLPRVLGRDRELCQVFLNLLLNAAQAMTGRGRIVVTLGRSGDSVVVEVRDDGPGIPAEIRDRVFEPFFTTKARGGGLGLPIARRTAELHGGSLVFNCPPGGGTVVTLTLPLHPVVTQADSAPLTR